VLSGFTNHNGQTAIDGQLQDPAMAVSAGPAGYGTEGEITDTEHVRLLLRIIFLNIVRSVPVPVPVPNVSHARPLNVSRVT